MYGLLLVSYPPSTCTGAAETPRLPTTPWHAEGLFALGTATTLSCQDALSFRDTKAGFHLCAGL